MFAFIIYGSIFEGISETLMAQKEKSFSLFIASLQCTIRLVNCKKETQMHNIYNVQYEDSKCLVFWGGCYLQEILYEHGEALSMLSSATDAPSYLLCVRSNTNYVCSWGSQLISDGAAGTVDKSTTITRGCACSGTEQKKTHMTVLTSCSASNIVQTI